MSYTHTKRAAIGLLFLGSLCRPQALPDVSPLDGYTAGQVQQGAPFGSFALSGLESLNTASGTLSLNIPVVTVQGRGNVSVPLNVNVTPPIWDVTAISYEYNCNQYSCQIGWLYVMSLAVGSAQAPSERDSLSFARLAIIASL